MKYRQGRVGGREHAGEKDQGLRSHRMVAERTPFSRLYRDVPSLLFYQGIMSISGVLMEIRDSKKE